MHTRPILAALLLFSAPVQAAPPDSGGSPLAFEKRAVAILNAGGTTDTIEGRLNAIGSGIVLTDDQRVAVDALKLLVRSRTKPDGMSMADAEAFAARNPTSPASAMLLAEAALADDQPQRSADTLIEIAPKAGSLIQLVSPTAVSKLTDELDAISDRQRISGLAKALLYARWGRGSISLRSYLALAAMRDELAAGHVERAQALLALVKSPATLHEILIDGRLTPLQASVEQAAGPRLEKAWRDYLTATRDDWTSRADALSATGYVEALKQANQYDALADAFLLRFLKGYNCPSDTVARSIGSDLADSLAKTNRWAKAEDIMRRSGGVSQPIYATMLLERGDFGRAASLYERSLKAADAPKGKKEEKALAWLRAADDCAAFRSGGGGSTAPYDPALLDVSARLFVLLCLNRPSEAKAALIAALADENERADALRWVQPFKDPPVQSKFRAEMNEKIRAMQRDADVLAVVSRYGRVLDWPFTSAVPTTDELAVAKAGGAWQCGDQSNWQAGMPEVESVHLPDSQQ